MDRRRFLCPRLVGRHVELERFEQLLERLSHGKGATVLISGEPGVGKSALLRQFARQARGKGVPFLAGECTVIEARRPFGAFVEVLEAALARGLGGVTVDWLERTHADLARLRRDAPAGVSGLQRDESERYRVHASFVRFLRTLAAASPLVLALDDLQWADEATLELLPFVAKKLRDGPILIVATHRATRSRENVAFERAMTEIDRERTFEHARLAPLTPEEVAQVVDATLGMRGLAASRLLEVLDRCEGNPFFIEEVLIGLVESGDLSREGSGWVLAPALRSAPVPRSLGNAVEQRLRTLLPGARYVVRCAAVIGPRFDLALLRDVAETPESELIDHLRSAIDAQLVVELAEPAASGTYAFRHALTRESVLSGLLRPERQAVHRLIGERLEARGEARARIEELAYHFDEAGDYERAASYHELAARDADALLAFARARAHLDRCAALLPEGDPRRIDVLLTLSRVAFEGDDRLGAARAADEAYQIALATGAQVQAGRALLAACWPRFQLGEDTAAAAALDRAIAILEPLGASAELAEAYASVAARALFQGRGEDGLRCAHRAVEMAHATGNRLCEVMATNWVGWALATGGDPAGTSVTRGAASLAEQNGLAAAAARSYLNLVPILRLWNAPPHEVQDALSSAAELSERHGWRSDRLIATEASHAFRVGRWDEALRFVSDLSTAPFVAHSRLDAAFAETARSGPERGLPMLEAVRDDLLSTKTPNYAVTASRTAETMLLVGSPAAALQDAAPAIEFIDRCVSPLIVDFVAVSAIVASKETGDHSARRRWLDVAREGSSMRPGSVARRAFALAERANDNDDLSGALAIYEEHAQLFERSFDHFAWTQTQFRRAETLLRRGGPGDAAAAAAVFAAIVPFWRNVGAAWYLARLRIWAAAHALPFPRARNSRSVWHGLDPAALTPREREVAALISAGLSNRKIAERLVIAERTAEGHVERIREKLGVASRTDITAWFRRTVEGANHALREVP